MNHLPNIQKIRRTHIRRLIIPLLIIICYIAFQKHYPFNSYYTAAKADTVSDIKKQILKQNTYLEINPDKLYYTGYNFVSSGKTTGSYYYAIIDDTCIYFLLEPYTGSISDNTRLNQSIETVIQEDKKTSDILIEKVAEDLSWTYNDLSDISVPLILNEISNHRSLYNICFSITIGILLFSLLALIKNLFLVFCPRRSPAYRQTDI